MLAGTVWSQAASPFIAKHARTNKLRCIAHNAFRIHSIVSVDIWCVRFFLCFNSFTVLRSLLVRSVRCDGGSGATVMMTPENWIAWIDTNALTFWYELWCTGMQTEPPTVVRTNEWTWFLRWFFFTLFLLLFEIGCAVPFKIDEFLHKQTAKGERDRGAFMYYTHNVRAGRHCIACYVLRCFLFCFILLCADDAARLFYLIFINRVL